MVVEYDGNTMVVHPGHTLAVDEFGNLVFAFGASATDGHEVR